MNLAGRVWPLLALLASGVLASSSVWRRIHSKSSASQLSHPIHLGSKRRETGATRKGKKPRRVPRHTLSFLPNFQLFSSFIHGFRSSCRFFFVQRLRPDSADHGLFSAQLHPLLTSSTQFQRFWILTVTSPDLTAFPFASVNSQLSTRNSQLVTDHDVHTITTSRRWYTSVDMVNGKRDI